MCQSVHQHLLGALLKCSGVPTPRCGYGCNDVVNSHRGALQSAAHAASLCKSLTMILGACDVEQGCEWLNMLGCDPNIDTYEQLLPILTQVTGNKKTSNRPSQQDQYHGEADSGSDRKQSAKALHCQIESQFFNIVAFSDDDSDVEVN